MWWWRTAHAVLGGAALFVSVGLMLQLILYYSDEWGTLLCRESEMCVQLRWATQGSSLVPAAGWFWHLSSPSAPPTAPSPAVGARWPLVAPPGQLGSSDCRWVIAEGLGTQIRCACSKKCEGANLTALNSLFVLFFPVFVNSSSCSSSSEVFWKQKCSSFSSTQFFAASTCCFS